MRNLCLLLLLANALFLGWSQFIDVRVTDLQRRTAAISPPPRIMLAREVGEAGAPAADVAQERSQVVDPPRSEPMPPSPSAPAIRKPAEGQGVCTSVGPFAESSEAVAAESALRSAGFKPRQRLVQGNVFVGYWVNVPGFASREAADEALKLLTSKGMSDVYVLPGADSGNVVSLGVFSDHQRAKKLAEEARALGLTPRIEDRTKAGSVYWIDVDQPAPVQPIDTSMFQTDPGKIMRLELRDCPTGVE